MRGFGRGSGGDLPGGADSPPETRPAGEIRGDRDGGGHPGGASGRVDPGRSWSLRGGAENRGGIEEVSGEDLGGGRSRLITGGGSGSLGIVPRETSLGPGLTLVRAQDPREFGFSPFARGFLCQRPSRRSRSRRYRSHACRFSNHSLSRRFSCSKRTASSSACQRSSASIDRADMITPPGSARATRAAPTHRGTYARSPH